MRVGRVVSIRVNPKDCMSAIDVVEKIGLNVPGISFSQIVSAAFSSAMESLRQAGVIPTRDGFEFRQMMAAYPAAIKGARGRALSIANTFQMAGPDAQVKAVAPSREVTQAQQRLDELLLHSEADPLNISSADQAEMEQLTEFLSQRLRGS